MSTDKVYLPLGRESIDQERNEQTQFQFPVLSRSNQTSRTTIFILSSIIFVLLALNGFFIFFYGPNDTLSTCKCDSEYGPTGNISASLDKSFPIQIYHSTPFTSTNTTDVARLWENLSGDPGVVALSHDFVARKRLPQAMPFPWDADKGVYLLQGFHNLHCLRTIFRYVHASDQNRPQRIAFSHILHCLDQLRQDVVCNADDTPRYAGFQDPPGTGAGQVRMCRDWGKLEAWARENTACFKHEDEVPDKMINRFKACPDGRVLW